MIRLILLVAGCNPPPGGAMPASPDAPIQTGSSHVRPGLAQAFGSPDSGAEVVIPEVTPQVVIIGGGPAGVVFADALGEGVILEADVQLGGRIVHTARPEFMFAGTPEQQDLGVEDSVDALIEDWEDLTGEPPSEATLEWLDETPEIYDDLVSRGASFEYEDGLLGGVLARAHLLEQSGSDLVSWYADTLDEDVTVMLDTPAEDVVVEDGRVTGVRVDGRTLHASAVVVATGGFVSRTDLLAEVTGWVDDGTWAAALSSDGASGTALDWAQAQDWGTARLDAIGWFSRYLGVPDGDDGLVSASLPGGSPWIWLNQDAERFVDEADGNSVVPGGHILDQQVVWGLASRDELVLDVDPSHLDVLQDAINSGLVHCDSDIDALAEWMGLEPVALTDTLSQVDDYRLGLAEDPLGRASAQFAELAPGGTCAFTPGLIPSKNFGGLDVDLDGRVRDTKGQVIQGLYAVGEAAGMGQPGLGGAHGFDGAISAIMWSSRRAARTVRADLPELEAARGRR